MRIANLAGRLVLLGPDGSAVDVADASAGRFGPDPQSVYGDWSAFTVWAADAPGGGRPFRSADLGPVTPAPRQVFAVGMNYRDHADEIGQPPPDAPSVFTKFASCFAGAYDDVALPAVGNTDWEVEIVAVIGRSARCVPEMDAWDHIAGLTIGQDVSERIVQTQGPLPQFSLGKSFPGFGPIGPWLVTVDEFDDPDDLALGCMVNGTPVQKSRSSEMIFTVPQLVAHLSGVVTLLPGDVIFTGTPAGVGAGRTPPTFLQAGDELVSWVEGVGEMRNRVVGGAR